MNKKTIASLIICLSLAAPMAASALTVGEIQSKIQELLSQIAVLKAQIGNTQGTTDPSTGSISVQPGAMRHRICATLNRNLGVGSTGDDVSGLQEFLQQEKMFSASATGYFGPVTAEALRKWQASQGIQTAGSVGPLTRERIKIWCGGSSGGPTQTGSLSVSPQKGLSPLTVTFKADVTLSNPGMIADAGDYKINFGDGSEQSFTCTSTTGSCQGPQTMQHTYTSNGVFQAKLIHYGYFGLPGPDGTNSQTVGVASVFVGDNVSCTKEYKPVCGSKQVVCITAPCNPVPTTYGNRCMMEGDSATFLYEGQCRTATTNPADDPQCKTWYDGCNTCSRQTPGGPAMCTLRACIQAMMAKPYCSAGFDSSSVNMPPVVSGLSGPTTLAVNTAGTWTVNASDPENGQLSYSIVWGDEAGQEWMLSSGASLAPSQFVQNTSFAHTYNRNGTFSIVVSVKDDKGAITKTSTTVQVGSTISGCVSGGVTYPEGFTRTCINSGSGDACLSTGFYSCRNTTWRAEGTTGGVACTADAMQCPNGQWVGRTGPSCQFVCSN